MLSAWTTAARSQTIADIPDIDPSTFEQLFTQDETARFLTVVLNGAETGLIAEFFQPLGQTGLSATHAELEDVGIRTRGRGTAPVALESIEGLRYVYDEPRQLISINAALHLLVPYQISGRPAPQRPEAQSGLGAVLNYRVSGNFGDNVLEDGFSLRTLYAGFDARIYAPLGVLTSTGSISYSGHTGSARVRRNDTHFIHSDAGRMLRYTLGDFASSALPWTRSVRLGGVQLRRDFSLRSDVVTSPMLSYSGVAALPTTIDLYIDSVRTWSGSTEAGPFVVRDLPFVTSQGEAVFVLRDESGREEEARVPIFASRDLLAAGTFDFSLQAGRAREDYGLRNFGYGSDTLGSATLRYGLTDRLTVYAHLEGTPDLRAGSFGFSTTIFNRAEVTVAAGASRYGEQTGGLGHISLRTGIGRAELRFSSTRTSHGYRDLAYAAGAEYLGDDATVEGLSRLMPVRVQDAIALSIPLSSAQFGVSYIHSERRDAVNTIASVSYSKALGRGDATFRLSAFMDIAEGGFGLAAAISMPLGANATGTAGLNRSRNGDYRAGVRAMRRLNNAPGSHGYMADASADDTGALSGRASASYRSRFGTAEVGLRHDTRSGRTGVNASMEGAIVVAGGGVFAANPIRDAFAVVDLGVPNVPVMLHNRPIAWTGASGRALVPNLQSYRRNRISVDVDELPLDAAVGATAVWVVPARRSGVTALMGGGAGSSALVVLTNPEGAFIAPGSRAFLNGSTEGFVVGYDGELWLEGLKGQNEIRVDAESGACTARFRFQPLPGDIVTIDQVECA